jgi:hypothetical protein
MPPKQSLRSFSGACDVQYAGDRFPGEPHAAPVDRQYSANEEWVGGRVALAELQHCHQVPDGGGQPALDVGAEGLFDLSGEVVIAEQVSQGFEVVWPVFFSAVGGRLWPADPRGR